MRLQAAMLIGVSLFAQQGKLIPPAERKDVSAFSYTDFPDQNKTLKVSDAKGKVMVFVFLKEGNQAAKKCLGEVRWLQEQEAAMGMLVVPVYDPASIALLDTVHVKLMDDEKPLENGAIKETGMFRNLPISFHIYQEFVAGAHTALFPKFEGQPATFFVDRQGRIATSLFGYTKGSFAKAAKAVLEESAPAN
jgi:hypothetical protein